MKNVGRTNSVSAIVVHHNRHEYIGGVIADLVHHGVDPSRLVVVDNSERPEQLSQLAADLPPESHIHAVENRGYGAAVNDGLQFLERAGLQSDYTLVTTHEVQVLDDCLLQLAHALDTNPNLVAVGPVLRSSLPTGQVWSTGGALSRHLKTPQHQTKIEAKSDDNAGIREAIWLDGAIVLYRTSALPRAPFEEPFFLYVEEVDLHLRLRHAGGGVAVVNSAVASQQSAGTPPYYFARNIRLLHRRHSPRGLRVLRAGIPIARRLAGAVTRSEWDVVRSLLRGAVVTLPPNTDRAVLINPLGGALAHYTLELRSVLSSTGVSADSISVLEPSVSGIGRLKWLSRYASALRQARRLQARAGKNRSLITWPVVGFYDVPLVRLLLSRASLVIHDPVPLVRAAGYGKIGRALARLGMMRVELVTHSTAARRELAAFLSVSVSDLKQVAHPIMLRESPAPTVGGTKHVVVMGQYKPDRDLDLLTEIAKQRDEDWELTIVGRGWPAVEGWNVEAKFVSEEEFDEWLRRSAAVIIPYRRFYQSGVAIRALEMGTAVVGPRNSVLGDILGRACSWLADGESSSWISGIRAATQASAEEIEQVRKAVLMAARRSWCGYLTEEGSK